MIYFYDTRNTRELPQNFLFNLQCILGTSSRLVYLLFATFFHSKVPMTYNFGYYRYQIVIEPIVLSYSTVPFYRKLLLLTTVSYRIPLTGSV